MGLLDSLTFGSQGGYGGLLDALMYPSPRTQRQGQPDPDTMAGFIPPQAPDPFGPTPGGFIPKYEPVLPPSVFNQGTTPAAGFVPSPTSPVPPLPPAQTIKPTPQPPVDQVNNINVGGYQMPRFGGVADFTPPAPQSGATDISAQSRQPPQMPQATQPPQALPPAFGGGSVLGRLGHPEGLISKLTGNDSRSIAQQNLKAQYDSLVPLLGPQKAMLAVMNPKAAETLIPQALEKKKYGFQKMEDGTIVRTDELSGKAELAYGSERGNTMQGPDGKPLTMPEGADAKTWRNEITRINADVAAGKKTEVQAKAEIFGNKMEMANKSITDNVGTSLAGKIASGLPLGNYVQSADYQKYKAASSNFITALLRQESGAAISKTEFDRYDREYMPQPGDGPEVLAQKTEARRVAIEGMKKGAGPGYKSPTGTQTGLPSGWSVQVR